MRCQRENGSNHLFQWAQDKRGARCGVVKTKSIVNRHWDGEAHLPIFLQINYEKIVGKGEQMVGKRIKEYLVSNGIKQSFVAEKTGLSTMVISDICNKDRRIDCMEYYKICKALNVPLETFLEEGEA